MSVKRTLKAIAESNSHSTHVRVGVGGWNFAPWRSNFYPAGLPQKQELEYASRHLTAIEVNSTFYAAQKPATYANWRKQTPEGFVFSLKAPRYATASKDLGKSGKTISGFVSGGLSELGDRLGPISWQLMPTRRFEHDNLDAFLQLLPRQLDGRPLRHVLEVRHESFRCAEFVTLMRNHHIATVFTDSADYPSFADITGDFVYARLMGTQDSLPHGYDDRAIGAWATRAKLWASGREPVDLPRVCAPVSAQPSPARDVFIYFISGAKERNPLAAMALIERLNA